MKILIKQPEKAKFEVLRTLLRDMGVKTLQKFPFLIIEKISEKEVVKILSSNSWKDSEIFSYRRF